MYYQNYEDYMKSVLGNSYTNEYINQNYNIPYTSVQTMPVNANYMENASKNNMQNNTNLSTYNKEINGLEKMEKIKKIYPDIYYLLMPMVNKIVEENKDKEITKSLIENMTLEICNNIEEDMKEGKSLREETIKTGINFSNTKNNINNNRLNTTQNNQLSNSRTNSSNIHFAKTDEKEKSLSSSILNQNNKRIGNPVLKDLIKVLIINKILENLKNENKISAGMNYTPNRTQMINQIPMQSIGYYPNNQYMQMNQKINQVSPMLNRYTQMPQESTFRNIQNTNYPYTNYFSTPYPEDEWVN